MMKHVVADAAQKRRTHGPPTSRAQHDEIVIVVPEFAEDLVSRRPLKQASFQLHVLRHLGCCIAEDLLRQRPVSVEEPLVQRRARRQSDPT